MNSKEDNMLLKCKVQGLASAMRNGTNLIDYWGNPLSSGGFPGHPMDALSACDPS